MKKILELNVVVYEYKDLEVESQARAIFDHINFWLECREYNKYNQGNYEKAMDEVERLGVPWLISSYIYKYCKQELLSEIIGNQLFYSEDGDAILLRMVDGRNGELCLNPTTQCAVTLVDF